MIIIMISNMILNILSLMVIFILIVNVILEKIIYFYFYNCESE